MAAFPQFQKSVWGKLGKLGKQTFREEGLTTPNPKWYARPAMRNQFGGSFWGPHCLPPPPKRTFWKKSGEAILKIGDLVRAKVRTITGWKGTGTVTAISGDFVDIIKSDAGSEATFLRCQVARIKTQ